MPDLAQHEIQRGAGVMSQTCHDPTDAAAWVIQAGLAGVPELDLLRGFCERAVATGLPIARAQVLVDTLHPIHEGDGCSGGKPIGLAKSSNTAARPRTRRSPTSGARA